MNDQAGSDASNNVLLLAQVDDCSGEVLGEALEQLTAMGVRNVQLMGSLTKKGRPGNVLLLDLSRDLEPQVALFLATELGVWGYHVLQSTHRHFDVALEERRLRVTTDEASRLFTVRCKLFHHQGQLLRIKLEHADAVEIAEFIRLLGRRCSLRDIRCRAEYELWSRPNDHELEMRV